MAYSTAQSESAFAEASKLLPGGVNSPVRAFRSVGGTPVYFDHGSGSRLWDVDGNQYIDYIASWGAIIHGHADPEITRVISDAASRSTSYGAPHKGEISIAEEVISRVPGMEMVRFVNSGSEAATAMVRLARGATGRSKILKFAGCYHGAVDSLLAKAGSGIATFGLPDSAGVTPEAASNTLTAPYNDLDAVSKLLEASKGEVAAIVVEPVAGNMGCVPPKEGFLQGLRKLADDHQCLFVLDEVMTGFRVSKGGAAARYGVTPDLYCLGKVIGGGLPVGAYGGRRDLMKLIAPSGPVYQAGTLSGNPLAMAAGLSALQRLSDASYEQLETRSKQLALGLEQAAIAAGVPCQVHQVGAMLSVFLTDSPVTDFDSAGKTDSALFGRLFHSMLRQGVSLPPSALECWFLTLSHTEDDISQTIDVFGKALKEAV